MMIPIYGWKMLTGRRRLREFGAGPQRLLRAFWMPVGRTWTRAACSDLLWFPEADDGLGGSVRLGPALFQGGEKNRPVSRFRATQPNVRARQ
jgi:hypothetical protein